MTVAIIADRSEAELAEEFLRHMLQNRWAAEFFHDLETCMNSTQPSVFVVLWGEPMSAELVTDLRVAYETGSAVTVVVGEIELPRYTDHADTFTLYGWPIRKNQVEFARFLDAVRPFVTQLESPESIYSSVAEPEKSEFSRMVDELVAGMRQKLTGFRRVANVEVQRTPVVESGFCLAGRQVFPDRNQVVQRDETRYITPKAMDLLVYLARNPQRTISKGELLSSVWPGRVVEEGVVHAMVSEVRKALVDSSREAKIIETVPRRGYRLAIVPSWEELT